MKSALLLIFSALLCGGAQAKNYYFSASGDDSRSASQASNPGTPWKSINKLNAVFSTLQPGDSVLFRRGDVFYGTIKPVKSGTSSAPIVISAYGSGAKPVITGSVTLDDWTSNGNGTYSTTNSALGERINMLTINGAPTALGRYPNAGAANKGYLTLDEGTLTSVTDSDLPSSPNWKGAEMVIRSKHWTLDRVKITSHSGKTLYHNTKVHYKPDAKHGYFLQNDVRTLDLFGEWAYNASAKKVTIYFGTKNPESYKIRASVLPDLLNLRYHDYIVIDNLSFEGANENAIDLYDTNKSRIQNCDIRNTGVDGMFMKYAVGTTIEGNEVYNTNSTGIFLEGGTDNNIIRGNTVRASGLWAGMGLNDDNRDMGMRVNGNSNLVEYNTIDSSGYCGLRFTGNNTIIRNNLITRFALVKDDAGGIYTSANKGTVNTGRKIQNNIILDGIGAKEGTSASTVQQVSGIYTDNFSTGIEITGNTIARCGKVGMYMHNAYNLVIKNNTCYDNTAQVLLNHDSYVRSNVTGIDMRNNIFFSKEADQPVAQFYDKDAAIAKFGTLDNNYYLRPIAETKTIWVRTFLYTSNETRKTATLDEWKPMYGHDDNSQKSFKTIPADAKPDDYFTFVYNASKQSKTVSLAGVYKDATKKEYKGTITLAPYTSAVLIKVGELTTPAPAPEAITAPVANKAPVVKFTRPTANATYNGPASIRVTASASDADGKITKVSFWVNGVFKKTETTAPYDWTLSNVPAGTYRIYAKAYDNSGNITRSIDVYVTVKGGTTSSINASESNVSMLPEDETVQHTTATLYPNPAVSNVYVQFAKTPVAQKAMLTISDMSGKRVLQNTVTLGGNNISVDVSRLTPGAYMLNLVADGLTTSQQFIKQ